MTLFKADPSQVVHAMDDAMLRRVFDCSPVDPADIPQLMWEETETGRWSPYVENSTGSSNVDHMEIVEDPVYGYFCFMFSGESQSEHPRYEEAVAAAQDFYRSNAGL